MGEKSARCYENQTYNCKNTGGDLNSMLKLDVKQNLIFFFETGSAGLKLKQSVPA